VNWHRAIRRDKLRAWCPPPAPIRPVRRSPEVSLSASRSRRLLALPLAVAAAGATACARVEMPQNTLNAKGPETSYILRMFWPIFGVAVAVFCLVAGLTLYIVVRFRSRGDDDAPVQLHGSAKLEISWTILPFLLMVGVGVTSVVGVFHLYRTPSGSTITFQPASATTPATLSGDVLQVNVIGHRWWWEFDYPGLGTGFDSLEQKPGISLVTAGELHIPAGKMVRLTVTSNEPVGSPEGRGPGVIHNFWVPVLAGKIYAEPGHLTNLNLEAYSSDISDGHPATFSGQCSEFCGLSHANMRLKVVAESMGDFTKWVEAQNQSQAPPGDAVQYTNPDAYAGYKLFIGSGGCATCHLVSGTPAAGQVGPNLTHLKLRNWFAGAIFELNDTNLRTWLQNPQAAKPGANMKIRKLTQDEITKLIAYLNTLK